MKESIGGTWIFVICMTFIVLFTGYLAISVNYSKAFRLKSNIVNEIEESDGLDGATEEKIKTYLTSQDYSAYGECPEYSGTDWRLASTIDDSAPQGKSNVCIYKMDVLTNNDDICDDRSYYKVVTFFKFDLPIINVLLTFKVSGDTDYILAGQNECI
ncbi:MAG TPA: hypothetical protein DCY94_05460 [Firmicutes bacterium]|nr:hypothetical protein [Bacillota bacterium]